MGGIIDLRRTSDARPKGNIEITDPDAIVAGETAPSPGITLIGAGIVIRASNIHIRHLKIRPGDDPGGPGISARDCISIYGDQGPVGNITIRNCSLSWSTDELTDTWMGNWQEPGFQPGNVSNVLYDRVIFSEPLDQVSGSNQTMHAHGMLLAVGSKKITVRRSLFAHTRKRTPWLANDGDALFINNVIYNPARQVMSIAGGGTTPSQFTAVGNVARPGNNTQAETKGRLMFVQESAKPGTQVYLSDNLFEGLGYDWSVSEDYYGGASGAAQPLTPLPNDLLPSSQVLSAVLAEAGARPFDRDHIDLRILDDVLNNTGKMIDSVTDVGGFPTWTPTTQPFSPDTVQEPKKP